MPEPRLVLDLLDVRGWFLIILPLLLALCLLYITTDGLFPKRGGFIPHVRLGEHPEN